MSLKKFFARLWVVAALPSQIPLWSVLSGQSVKSVLKVELFLMPWFWFVHIVPCFILFIIGCRWWLRELSVRSFLLTLLLSWGALGYPGAAIHAAPYLALNYIDLPHALLSLFLFLTVGVWPYWALIILTCLYREDHPERGHLTRPALIGAIFGMLLTLIIMIYPLAQDLLERQSRL